MGRFYFTRKAVDDLSEIWEYTYETWSEKQADHYYQLLITACQTLADNPQLGKKYEEVLPDLLGYSLHRHILFYRSISSSEIEIIRILHGRMDLKNRIKE